MISGNGKTQGEKLESGKGLEDRTFSSIEFALSPVRWRITNFRKRFSANLAILLQGGDGEEEGEGGEEMRKLEWKAEDRRGGVVGRMKGGGVGRREKRLA